MDARPEINGEKARLALQQVLESDTFARSEQLRAFLRYVCERSFAGHGKEINEYSVAVEALGRPTTFAPSEDSTVRRAAYELRLKLQKYYESERPEAPVRIELPKGSYTPRFAEAAERAVEPQPLAKSRLPLMPLLAGSVILILLASLGVALNALRNSPPGFDAVVREAWQPVAPSGGEVLVSVGTTLHMIVRPYMTSVAEGLQRYPAPPELYPLFRQHRPLAPGLELSMHPVDNSVQMGHTQIVAIAATTIRLLGATSQILPERAISAAALRGRNVIAIADPQNSNLAASRLESTPFSLEFSQQAQDVVIIERAARHRNWSGKRGPDKRYSEVYGLITVLPGEGEVAGPHRMVMFSGITSVGAHGAAEFFSQPDSLRQLRSRFAADGISGFPHAYQVVVRCRSNDTLLLAAEYVAHAVIAR